ncbi:MAG TPA: serine hydrolase domain-containing protein [Vicinamibacterales bacterium]|nr:serine hydrolase domain-containing protein [Vicinamibacterales bacterium]
MKRLLLGIAIAAAFAVNGWLHASAPVAAAQATAPGASGQATDLARALDAEMSKRGGVGATVAVVDAGRVILAHGFGRRSIDSPAQVTDATLFGVGSVTKQFTAAATLLLAEQGKLSVTDKVATYFPGLTRADDITLLDLMNHVSGYPDYYPLDFVDRRMQRPIAADALVREYAGGRLDFEPGSRWSYSNTGYILLGRILEKASGQPLGAFLTQHIFKPLGMSQTVFEPPADDPRVAPGYTSFALTPLTRAIREGAGWVGAAGAIYSTAADIARWDVALMDGRVLQKSSWQLMTKPRTLTNGKSSNYGCGLAVGTRDGVTVFTHGGAVSGFIARNTFIPETRSAVVAMINDEDGPLANALVERALAAVMPKRARDLPVTTGPSAAREDRGEVPRVTGPEPDRAVSALFTALQRGALDRGGLGEEYSAFVTPAKLDAAAKALKAYGTPTAAAVRSIGERGGMQVSSVRLTFGAGDLDALMYRSPDGKVQEFLLFRP